MVIQRNRSRDAIAALFRAAAVLAVLVLTACSSLLPRGKQTTESPWKSFDLAKAAYERIEPNKTTTSELKELGYDPFSGANIKILNYMDIQKNFIYSRKEELDAGIRTCIEAQSKCYAYEIEPKNITSKRYGNFWLDFFNFNRKSKDTGWRFKATILVVNDIVVYKLWGGDPNVEEYTEKNNPLGPLQDVGDAFINKAF